MESNVRHMEDTMKRVVEIQDGQQQLMTTLTQNIKLLTQSHNDFMSRYEKEDQPKITAMWENRSQFKGGWIVVSFLGGLCVGSAVIAGVLYEITKGMGIVH
jgi:hypothetical protein